MISDKALQRLGYSKSLSHFVSKNAYDRHYRLSNSLHVFVIIEKNSIIRINIYGEVIERFKIIEEADDNKLEKVHNILLKLMRWIKKN